MLPLATRPLPIIAPSSATAAFAAEQLAYYLAIITGSRFPVADDAVEGPAIRLRNDLHAAKPGSFRLQVSEAGIDLTGAGDLALLHAVYHFLETRCGCRWLSELDGGEIVPRDTELSVPFGDELVAPAFTNRAFTNFPDINADTVTMIDWMAKNRFNRFMVFANVEGAFDDYRRYLREEATLRGMKLEMGHHSFRFWVPPGEFWVEHPEYYSEIGGERVENQQLCTSSPALPGLVAGRIGAFFDQNPEFDRVGLWPNDGFGWCECPDCLNEEPQAASEVYSEQPRRTDTYIRFVNTVADRLAETHPEKRLSALAYVNYVEPPTADVAPNVDVCFAPMQRCVKHPFAGAPECIRPNARYAEFFDGWRTRVSGELYLFEYTMLIDMCSLPIRLTDMYPPNWAWLAEHGCDGYVMEYKPQEWGTYGVNGYLLGRYAWEPCFDQNAFLERHYADLYGPAAGEMTAFFEALMRDFIRPGPCLHHYDLTYTRRATEALLRPALEHLGRARALAAGGDKRHWQAVEKARVGMELLLRFGEWQRHPEAAEARDELVEFARQHKDSGAVDLGRIELVLG